MIAPGTPIAVVAPASAFDPDRLARGVAIARERGHDLRPLPDLLRPHRYLAGTDDHRLSQLVHALGSDEYGAVWAARGGYGVTRILDRVPWSDLPGKPILGFSDLTPLLDAWAARGNPALHGPVVHSLPGTDDASLDHLFALLEGRPVAPLQGTAWVAGEAEGPLVGGNLCLIAATCGTRWQLDARDAILVLEEVGEAPYRVDRALQQLRQAGVLDGIVGVALGEFLGCAAPDGSGWSIDDVLREHLGALGVPVVADVAIGHGARNRAWWVRGRARIQGDRVFTTEARSGGEGRGGQ